MKLWLLRHAPVIAQAGLCYGATDLAAHAHDTTAVAARIASELPRGIALVTSPRVRCKSLAGAIAALRPDLSLTVDARLAEMDFGAWEGRAWKAIPRAEFEAWTAGFTDTRPGAGETVREFMQRVEGAWADWRSGGVDAVWVTHAGVMRAATLLQAGIRCPADAAQWPSFPIAFGEWRTIEFGQGLP